MKTIAHPTLTWKAWTLAELWQKLQADMASPRPAPAEERRYEVRVGKDPDGSYAVRLGREGSVPAFPSVDVALVCEMVARACKTAAVAQAEIEEKTTPLAAIAEARGAAAGPLARAGSGRQ